MNQINLHSLISAALICVAVVHWLRIECGLARRRCDRLVHEAGSLFSSFFSVSFSPWLACGKPWPVQIHYRAGSSSLFDVMNFGFVCTHWRPIALRKSITCTRVQWAAPPWETTSRFLIKLWCNVALFSIAVWPSLQLISLSLFSNCSFGHWIHLTYSCSSNLNVNMAPHQSANMEDSHWKGDAKAMLVAIISH